MLPNGRSETIRVAKPSPELKLARTARVSSEGNIQVGVEVTRPTVRAVRVLPQVRTVEALMQHEPVRVSLRHLTGRDFGYDQDAWRRWWDADGRQLVGNESDVEPPAAKQAQPRKRADTPNE